MNTKLCPDCQTVKPVDQFYRNKRTADGRYRTCIECTKQYNHSYYQKNPDKFVEYREQWQQNNPNLRLNAKKSMRKFRELFPEKYKARTAVANALAKGRLTREPCEVCGKLSAEAHHDDYTKLLEVRWLCRFHHMQHHGRIVHESL